MLMLSSHLKHDTRGWLPDAALARKWADVTVHDIKCKYNWSPQAGAGLVADSVPESEYEETVNKAAALGRAVDLAEHAFVECTL